MTGLSRAFALLVLSLGVAAAEPKPTAQQKADIEKLAKQAIAKSQKGDHEGAIKDYLDAYAIAPGAATVLLSNVGHEYKTLGKPYDALKYFCMYLEKEPTGSAASYVLSEASGIWKEVGGKEGEVCVQKPEPPPPPKPDPKPDPDHGQVTGTTHITNPPPKTGGGGGMRLAGLGIAGAGVVALGAGLFFGVKAKAKDDLITGGPPPVDPTCTDPTCERLDWGPHADRGWDGIVKLQEDGARYEKMQIAFTSIGGAMIIGGTALYFLGRSKAKAEVALTPSASSNSAGVAVSGRF